MLLNGDASKVTLSYNEQNTELSFTTNDGLPLEIDLKLDVSSSYRGGEGMGVVKVYPNPADRLVYLEGYFPENSTWEIISMQGVIVGEGIVNQRQTIIPFDGILNGLFLIRVKCDHQVLYSGKLTVLNL